MLEDILKQLDYMAVLAPYNPKPKGSREISVTCPKCNHNEAYIFRDGRAIICRRGNQCGQTTELLELAGAPPKSRGDDYVNGCEKLAAMGGVPFERKRMTPEQKIAAEEKERRSDALSLLRDLASNNLKNAWDDVFGHPAIDYLNKRNFDVIKCLEYGFGLVESVEQLQGVMTTEQLKELGLMIAGEGEQARIATNWAERILIPLQDYKGSLMGFSGRTYTDHKTKYINTRNSSIKTIVGVGLHHALQHGSTVIGVEGFLDPFKGRMNGIPNIVGIGTTGNALSPERWQALHKAGVKHFVFVTDDDRAGAEGLSAALRQLDKATAAPDVYLLTLDTGKDCDEWIDAAISRGEDPKALFSTHYKNRIHSDRYRARVFADGLSMESEGDKWEYIHRCMAYDETITNPKRALSLLNHFWPEVQQISGMEHSAIYEVCQTVRREKIQAERKKALSVALSQSKNSLSTDLSHEEITDSLRASLIEIETSYAYSQPTRVSPPQLLLSSDAEILNDIASKDYLGIAQGVLPQLDEMLSGLRGLTILAGDTNIGKTILLLQLALGSILNNPDVCCLFVSLEMPPQTLRFRILQHLTGMSLKELAQALRRGDSKAVKAMEMMEQSILPKLHIIHPEEPAGFVFSVANVCNESDQLKQLSGCDNCLIIVDYIGLMPIDENRYRTDLAQEKKRIADLIAIRNHSHSGAVLAVSEMRKKSSDQGVADRTSDDISGSARAMYSASNVLLMYRFSDLMLLNHFSCNMDYLQLKKYPDKKTAKDLKGDNAEEIENIKQKLDDMSIFPMQIKVDKIRDGGKKGKLNILMHWKNNTVTEGLNFDRY